MPQLISMNGQSRKLKRLQKQIDNIANDIEEWTECD